MLYNANNIKTSRIVKETQNSFYLIYPDREMFIIIFSFLFQPPISWVGIVKSIYHTVLILIFASFFVFPLILLSSSFTIKSSV